MGTSTAEAGFSEFYAATWSRTLACAYALTGELGSAEEVAQEAYARAWSRWGRLATYDEPAAWVRQVTTNLAVSRWRRLDTARRHLATARPPDDTRAPSEDTVALVAALRTLPANQRRAIVLHHLADLPVDQVARLEGCPAGTIKARLSRGRAALAALLSPDSDSPASSNGATSHA
ncbi:MAG: SigE family RNA polymerase sigma factor [Nocardioides sp.]